MDMHAGVNAGTLPRHVGKAKAQLQMNSARDVKGFV